MTEKSSAVPQKTRDLHSHHFDSTVWDDVEIRDDDIVIATYGKSGTTLIQQIVSQLLHKGSEDAPLHEISPWVDHRLPPKHVKLPMIEALASPRFLKTHLPVDALVFSPKAKYVYIARDGRDVSWSLHNHYVNANEGFFLAVNGEGLQGDPLPPPPEDPVDFVKGWVDNDGKPFWSFFENISSWWEIRHLDNVMLLHYADVIADLPQHIRDIASFLDIDVSDSEVFDRVHEHCTFSWMKKNSQQVTPLGGRFWKGGADTFINKGTNGRWQTNLPASVSEKYEQLCLERLGEECTQWLNRR